MSATEQITELKTVRERVMAASGRAGAAAGWTESRLVNHVRKRGGSSSDIETAKRAYRSAMETRP